jgi:hypothetical protein
VFNSQVANQLNRVAGFPPSLVNQLASTRSIPVTLSTSLKTDAITAFSFGSTTIFIIFLPISVIVLALALFVKVWQNHLPKTTRKSLTHWKDVGLGGKAESTPNDVEKNSQPPTNR